MASEDVKVNVVKKLYKLRKEKSQLLEQIKDIDESIANQETIVFKTLGAGVFSLGNYVAKINRKITKGRTNPAWKKIAEDVRSLVSSIYNKCIEEELDKKTASKFRNGLEEEYPNIVDRNSSTSEDKEVTTIEIDKVSKS